MTVLTPPLTNDVIMALRAGDRAIITGVIYTARDAAHRRLVELLDQGEPLPVDLAGQIIYYTGPTPAPPGRPIGSAGPTTAGRMDPYAPRLLAVGLKAMIGKGARSPQVREALRRHRAVYLSATPGAGALLSQHIVAAEVVAYPDLGTEAIHRLAVQNFPVIVANDCHGGDIYEEGVRRYRTPSAGEAR
ncbi:MAG TPA: Fe-S-containing hydro-lyase [Armatimonadota bacterium]|nr:Fe-S-containing hydro-lyase [Armatimonadota bacterium]